MKSGEKIELSENCLKLDRANAKALIKGFEKDEKTINQAIYCVVKQRELPMLITLNRSTQLKYKLSKIGKKLCQENFSVPYKYIAFPVRHYNIKNELLFWKSICSGGLFDIWDPEGGPFKRFFDPKICKSDPSKYMILLLRIWEIEEQFMNDEIKHASNYIDKIIKENRFVTLKKPVINDAEFDKIKEFAEESIKGYRFE